MANQMNVNKYRMCINTSLETAAKLRTYVKGKTVEAVAIGGRKVRKMFREMTVGDLMEQKADEVAKGVEADDESIKWMRYQLSRNVAKRHAIDEKVKAGAFRKPRSEWLKPGRKPGKKYTRKGR